MEQEPRHILLVIATVIISGMAVAFLFNYQEITKELGIVGAFFVTLLFSFLYSILILIGIALFIITYAILKKEYNLYIILISSALIINIHYIDFIYKFMTYGWSNVIIVYILSTYILVNILSLITLKLKNNIEGKNAEDS